MVLIPSVLRIKPLTDYANKIVDARKAEAPQLLPELLIHYPSDCEVANKLPHLMVDQVIRNEFVLAMIILSSALIVSVLLWRLKQLAQMTDNIITTG